MILTEEQFNILRLTRSIGATNAKIHKLLKIYNSCTEIVNNISKIDNKIILANKDEINKEIEECNNTNSKIITYVDNEYPQLLKQSDSFPLILTCKGNIELLQNTKTVAVIGSRNCSINSFNFSKKISREISSYGYIVVSGLAKGIDSSAHIGSIETGTIAVLGSGIDIIYPKENEYLYYDIISNNGLIITEFPIHVAPKPEHFIMRNRIIAGLSRGVLVMEAGISSGTMHTIGQILKLNREVMIFPGSPYDDRCAGSNKLLQDGATMVIDTKDVINCLESFMPDNCFKDTQFYYKTNEDNTNFLTDYKQEMDNNNEKESIEDIILSKLDYVPISIDELINNLDYDLNVINPALTRLQLNKKIIVESGKISLKLVV